MRLRVSSEAMTGITLNVVLHLLMTATTASSQSQGSTVPISQIRLQGGNGPHEGNIQVMLEGSSGWRYICDDGFGFPEADLICQDLGFEAADRFTKNNHFGSNTPELRRSSSAFLEDRLNCSFTDTSYRNCPLYSEPRFHDCIATEIAGVECRTAESQCQPDEFPCRDSSAACISRDQVCDGITQCPDNSDDVDELCSDISVARVKGNIKSNIPGAVLGTVQVKYNEEWGAMCDDEASVKEAKVICRSMGYIDGWTVAFSGSYLGEAKQKIQVFTPSCNGNEEWLAQCPDFRWGQPNRCMEETEDFGVFCYNEGVEVRLTENGSPNSGRVEMKMAGRWGSVCDSGFDIFDAQVICRMLGYHGDAVAHRGSGRGTGLIWGLRLDCLGGEQDVQDCRVRIINGTCSLSNTAGVTCSHSSGKVDSDLRNALGNTACGVPEDASNQFLTRLAKVRGGFPPSRFDTPWLVSLRQRKEIGGDLYCGGVIISEDFVLTAAHCLQIRGKLSIMIRVGDYNSDFDEESEEDFFMDKSWVHEYEDENAFNDNDIALIKIERKNGRGIRFGSRVKPICLPSVTDNYDQLSKCTVVGWGRTFHLDDPSPRPREAETTIISDRFCEVTSGGPSNFTSSMVCAWQFGVNPCGGDSGGPLACPVNGRQTLYGMVSTGVTCTINNSPHTYIRVTKFIDWILEKVQLSSNGPF